MRGPVKGIWAERPQRPLDRTSFLHQLTPIQAQTLQESTVTIPEEIQ